VEVGVGTDEELEVEGYDLIESNVLWDTPGEYEATYYYRSQPSYFYRTVIVPRKQSLTRELPIIKNKRSVKHQLFIMSAMLFLKMKIVIMFIGTIESEDPLQQSILLQEYAFIAYYKHHVKVFCHRFDESYSYLSGAELSEAGLVYFLTFTNGDDTDVQIGEITQTGTIIRSQDFGGSGDEIGI
jgi:hypothetical protein